MPQIRDVQSGRRSSPGKQFSELKRKDIPLVITLVVKKRSQRIPNVCDSVKRQFRDTELGNFTVFPMFP